MSILTSFRRWWNCTEQLERCANLWADRERNMVQAFSDARNYYTSEISQLKFLLESAPMIDAPVDKFAVMAVRSPFAYIHPKTLAKYSTTQNISRPDLVYARFAPSPTKWVLTHLMPEGRVIYSPNPLPGLENLLARP